MITITQQIAMSSIICVCYSAYEWLSLPYSAYEWLSLPAGQSHLKGYFPTNVCGQELHAVVYPLCLGLAIAVCTTVYYVPLVYDLCTGIVTTLMST